MFAGFAQQFQQCRDCGGGLQSAQGLSGEKAHAGSAVFESFDQLRRLFGQAHFAENFCRLGTNFRIGIGYNFTDFSDNLTNFDYDHKGWFVNLTGQY